MNAIRYEKDRDQIVTLTMDNPGSSANVMNADFRKALVETVQRLEDEIEEISGVIIVSAKKTFFAGGDLTELVKVGKNDGAAFFELLTQGITGPLRKLEKLGKPIVAAINGAALGGGWEIALACHHRVCVNNPKIQLGLPEVTLGLLPGGGGLVRTVRLLGLEKAMPYLLEGKKNNPEKALKMGLLHQLVEDQGEMIQKARNWIKNNPEPVQPWDIEGYKMPGGTPNNPKLAALISVAPAMLHSKTKGCYPAPEAILAAMVEGAQVDFDTAQKIESRYFMKLVTGQVAKNMIGTFWFQMNEIKAGKSRPRGFAPNRFKKIGILGAGMMGAGIAYSCAIQGFEVVLKDVSMENAKKGKAYSATLLEKKVSSSRMSAEKKDTLLELIHPTAKIDDLAGCDLIIEAVFEDRHLKASVTVEAEALMVENGVFASNTSTLPITGLAFASKNAENFVGLHFFSPVDKMPLVEIIKGERTSPETLARAFDFVLRLKKTPIVVNDSRGFFTSRVFGTFVKEGMAMLGEGQVPASIEKAALLAGLPVGPLAITDEVSLTLLEYIRLQTSKDLQTEGKSYEAHPADRVLDKMINQLKRNGKAEGAGFYEYPETAKKFLWPGLKEEFPPREPIDFEEMKDRLLFIQAVETVRCLEENILTSVGDANIGSIFGLGFPAWSGGVIQFINQYGLEKFINRTRELAKKYGSRFDPPALLLEKAKQSVQF